MQRTATFVAAILFRWVSRRVRFYRTMVLDPILARVWSGYGEAKSAELIVFPKADFGPFQEKSRLRLKQDLEAGSILEPANWWMPSTHHKLAASPLPQVKRGWVMNRIDIGADQLLFSRRYNAETLNRLADQMGLAMDSESLRVDPKGLSHEFA